MAQLRDPFDVTQHRTQIDICVKDPFVDTGEQPERRRSMAPGSSRSKTTFCDAAAPIAAVMLVGKAVTCNSRSSAVATPCISSSSWSDGTPDY